MSARLEGRTETPQLPPAVSSSIGVHFGRVNEESVMGRIRGPSCTAEHNARNQFATPGFLILLAGLRNRDVSRRQIPTSSHYTYMRQVLIALVSGICLCAAPAFAASSNTTHPTTAHANVQGLSDAQIDANIRTKLAKSKIGKDGFRFKVSHGVVTWEGTTSVIQHKGSATRMARTAGAVQVVNNIQISAAARVKAGANLKKAVVTQ